MKYHFYEFFVLRSFQQKHFTEDVSMIPVDKHGDHSDICISYNKIQNPTKHFILRHSSLYFSGPPTASQRHLQQVARLGEDVKIICPVEGHPVPLIVWYKSGEVLDNVMDHERYRTNKKSLRIKNVEYSDSGKFTCKGVNGFGKKNVTIDLMVINPDDFPNLADGEVPDISPPTLSLDTLNLPDTYRKRPEETLRISCEANGKPQPEIVWYKNGHELLENTHKKQGKNVLFVRNLMSIDEGNYTCVAWNVFGKTTKDFQLFIEEDNYISGLINKTAREGDTEVFDCHVNSPDKPKIRWVKKLDADDNPDDYKPEEIFNGEGDDKYHLINGNKDIVQDRADMYLSQLVIQKVTQHHSGMYSCLVFNSRGTNYKRAFLTVIPSKILNSSDLKFCKSIHLISGSESLTSESPFILILVICLSVVVVILLVSIIVCVVRRKQKDASGPQETGEVRHNLMSAPGPHQTVTKSDQPLPPPPASGQWAHLYTSGSGQYLADSGVGTGNTYEVPHHHPATRTPAPSLQYGYSSYPHHPPSLASMYSGSGSGKHVVPVYYPDRAVV